jgi:hypothetical protein
VLKARVREEYAHDIARLIDNKAPNLRFLENKIVEDRVDFIHDLYSCYFREFMAWHSACVAHRDDRNDPDLLPVSPLLRKPSITISKMIHSDLGHDHFDDVRVKLDFPAERLGSILICAVKSRAKKILEYLLTTRAQAQFAPLADDDGNDVFIAAPNAQDLRLRTALHEASFPLSFLSSSLPFFLLSSLPSSLPLMFLPCFSSSLPSSLPSFLPFFLPSCLSLSFSPSFLVFSNFISVLPSSVPSFLRPAGGATPRLSSISFDTGKGGRSLGSTVRTLGTCLWTPLFRTTKATRR